MTDKQRYRVEGMDMLLRRFSKYPDDTSFTVGDIIEASNNVYDTILSNPDEEVLSYETRVYYKKQLLCVKHYVHFQNALAAVLNGDVFDNIPSDVIEGASPLGEPSICYGSKHELTSIADDFHISFPNGVLVVISTLCYEDCGVK